MDGSHGIAYRGPNCRRRRHYFIFLIRYTIGKSSRTRSGKLAWKKNHLIQRSNDTQNAFSKGRNKNDCIAVFWSTDDNVFFLLSILTGLQFCCHRLRLQLRTCAEVYANGAHQTRSPLDEHRLRRFCTIRSFVRSLASSPKSHRGPHNFPLRSVLNIFRAEARVVFGLSMDSEIQFTRGCSFLNYSTKIF